MKKFHLVVAIAFALSLVACGGGGSSSTSSSSGNASSNSGSTGSSSGSTAATASSTFTGTTSTAVSTGNAVPIYVGDGPGDNANSPYVSVTVCQPGTSTCQTINDVLVDTGSYGLRILSSALNGTTLPAQSSGGSSTILECAPFGSGVTWGSIKLADVHMGGEAASSVPVQIVADPAYSTIPSICTQLGSTMNTPATLGANGILGVGQFVSDVNYAYYYTHAPTSVSDRNVATISATAAVQNPVALFSKDNNGVVVQLPAVAAAGTTSINGTLLFGIGTQTNNAATGAIVIPADSSGNFTSVYKGTSMPYSFFDSGSNGLFFVDSSIAQCSGGYGWYCPSTTLNLTASLLGANSASNTVNFSIANLTSAPQSYFVFSNLGGTMYSGTFDWGLPFFMGRSVYIGFDGKTSPAGTGPLYAYTN